MRRSVGNFYQTSLKNKNCKVYKINANHKKRIKMKTKHKPRLGRRKRPIETFIYEGIIIALLSCIILKCCLVCRKVYQKSLNWYCKHIVNIFFLLGYDLINIKIMYSFLMMYCTQKEGTYFPKYRSRFPSTT